MKLFIILVEVDFTGPGPDGQPTGQPAKTYDYTPHAGGADFDDSSWESIQADTLQKRRGAGRMSFNWYRLKVTIPERIGGYDPTGATVVFQTSLDDYAEIWVDGELSRAAGQTGGPVVSGWNAINRLTIGRDVKPGQQIQLAIFGINGPLSNPPTNFIWIRHATLEFFNGTAGPVVTTPSEVNVEVVRNDPEMNQIVGPNPKVYKLAEGFKFTEGPVWINRDGGYLLFSDPNSNIIYKYKSNGSEPGELSVFRSPSGYQGADIAEYGQPGSNGLTVDRQGRLTINQHGNRRVIRIENDNSETVIANMFEGKRLNSPNDLVYRSDGTLFFTDPPFGLPAVSHEPRIQHLADDLERAGLKPFHVPLGIRIDESNPRKSACIRCNTCDGHPCLIGAKSDSQTICVDPALEHENVSLITNAQVMRLETNGNAREVSRVIVNRNGVQEEYSGDIVVVSCGAVNSAALLLRSASDKYPLGLANGSDVVGRHYMGHINSVLMALSKCPNPTIFQKTLAINDFYFGSRDWDYPMGHISFVGKLDADTLRAGAPKVAPGWTLDLMAKHSLDFWLTSEDLPDPNNRVTVNRDGQIMVSYKLNNVEGHDRLKASLQKAMKQTNCDVHGYECHQGLFARNLYLGQRLPLAAVAHQNGTVRFGEDPRTSALDRNCKAHEVDNLYVVDASFFPSSGAVNPALTIMANALRVGDQLLEKMR